MYRCADLSGHDLLSFGSQLTLLASAVDESAVTLVSLERQDDVVIAASGAVGRGARVRLVLVVLVPHHRREVGAVGAQVQFCTAFVHRFHPRPRNNNYNAVTMATGTTMRVGDRLQAVRRVY